MGRNGANATISVCRLAELPQAAMAKDSPLERASSTDNAHKSRLPLLDTVFVRGLVWMTCAMVLIAPLAAPRLVTSAAIDQPAQADIDRDTTAPTSQAPNSISIEFVRGRLEAILRSAPNGFDMPDSGLQAADALQWCARRIANSQHMSLADSGGTLSQALVEPGGDAGVRVVNALEEPAPGASELLRLHCASLLYDQLQYERAER